MPVISRLSLSLNLKREKANFSKALLSENTTEATAKKEIANNNPFIQSEFLVGESKGSRQVTNKSLKKKKKTNFIFCHYRMQLPNNNNNKN